MISVFLSLKALLSPVAFGVSAIAQDETGRVLLVRHRYMAGWHLPGGGVKRGEPPGEAILRELREEAGLAASEAPEFFGIYTRKTGLATNVVALYCLREVRIDFTPTAEIAAVQFADAANPPPGTAAGTLRRLAEMTGKTPQSPYW